MFVGPVGLEPTTYGVPVSRAVVRTLGRFSCLLATAWLWLFGPRKRFPCPARCPSAVQARSGVRKPRVDSWRHSIGSGDCGRGACGAPLTAGRTSRLPRSLQVVHTGFATARKSHRTDSGAGEPAGVGGSRVDGVHHAVTRSALDAARRWAESGAQDRRREVARAVAWRSCAFLCAAKSLRLRSSESTERAHMGILGRPSRRDDVVPFLMPDGSAPDFASGADLADAFVYTQRRRDAEGIPLADAASYPDAGLVYMIGIPEDDPILVWGDVAFREATIAPRGVEGVGVMTGMAFVVWWQSRRLTEAFVGPHPEVMEMSPIDGGAEIAYADGVRVGRHGNLRTGPTRIQVRRRLGKDPHANRRAISTMNTLIRLSQGTAEDRRG